MRNLTRYTTLVLAVLSFCTMATSQQLRFSHFTIDDGLPTNQIQSLSTDGVGFLWMESPEGITRYDGSNFHHIDWMDITTSDHDSIQSIIGQRNNQIIGLYQQRAYAFGLDCNIDDYSFLNVSQQLIGISNALNPILIENLTCKNLNSDSLEIITSTDGPDIQWINYHPDTAIINIPNKGLYTAHLEGQELSINSINAPIPTSPLLNAWGTQEGVWYISGNQIIKWGRDFNVLQYEISIPLGYEQIQHIHSDGDYVFFAAGSRLYRLDLETQETLLLSVGMNIQSEINDLYLDHEENLWVATEGDGLFCIYQSYFSGYSLGILGQTSVHHLYNTQNMGLLAATDDGLFIISSGWSRLPLSDENNPTAIYYIQENESGNIYLRTDKYIQQFKNGTLSECLELDSNHKLFSVSQHNIGITTDNHSKWNISSGCNLDDIVASYDITEPVNCIQRGMENDIWLGTHQGLFQITGDGNLLSFTQENGLAHNRVNDLRMGPNQKLYIGTDGGLSIMNIHNKRFRNYTNLPSPKCRKLAVNGDGKVWIYTLTGIYSFTPDEEEDIQQLGIPVNGVNALEVDKNGKLWIGTPRGLLSYSNNTFRNRPAPHLFWNELYLDNSSIESPDNIILSPNGILDVSFGSIAYKDVQKVTFQYKLQDEAPWQNTKNRSLTFSNLNPGNYNLQIRVQHPNSTWSKPLSLSFEVIPPFWKRWTFIVPILLLITALIAGFLRNVRKREKKKIETRRRYAELELKALQSQMSPHFIFNTLNAIQHAIMKGNSQVANTSLNRFATLMRLFLESSKSKYIPLQDEVQMLQLYCELTRLCYEGKFDYTIKVDPNLDLEDTEIPSMMIQPHVENAIRHGLLPLKEKGNLDIDFSMNKQYLVCTIKDDGIGRTKAKELKKQSQQVRTSIGNTLTQERANILNEIHHSNIRIKITDLRGRKGNPLGTDVKIIIPTDL